GGHGERRGPERADAAHRGAGAKRNPTRRATRDRDGTSPEGDDRADLGELGEKVEVLGGIALRKAAHPRVRAGVGGDRAADRVERPRRTGEREAEHVVAERNFVEPNGARERTVG